MQEGDIQALRRAVAALEHPGLAARLADIAGKPIELFNRALPQTASKAIAVATTQALDAALRVAFRTMQNEPKGFCLALADRSEHGSLPSRDATTRNRSFRRWIGLSAQLRRKLVKERLRLLQIARVKPLRKLLTVHRLACCATTLTSRAR